MPLPVMLWIHGGGFFQGSASDAFYDGSKLASAANVIVVSFNYRLGALGFFSHRELAVESAVAVHPAVGFLDQRAAMRWVRDEIDAFGGNPANITIFGESAGAWSVCSHLASPGSRGLFARAIMQSGACSDALYFDGAKAQHQADALAEAVHCGGSGALACLRAKSADELVNALPFRRGLLLEPGVWWGPVVDGVALPQVPLTALEDGAWAGVPLIIGWAQDEGTLHTRALETVDSDELQWFVNDVFGPATAERLPASYRQQTPKDALTNVVSDGIFRCNARRVARTLVRQKVPVFVYEFARALDNPAAHALGATHGVDLFFVFGNEGNGIGLSAAERPLSRLLMESWGRFAHSGVPGDEQVEWPPYDMRNESIFRFAALPSTAQRLERPICDRWDELSNTAGR